ncbi:GNAT family N-acetyltransferase [Sphingobacterium sp. HMA12]|uniref:GNAT family N-acetyltransferase n=1 Tax=Sphingobacterium sp. HMA12 TaxID=2050894 RepID=UPI000CEA01D2|nr:GNAT family N-acetyltransferase [Sphingobacterium sp. HMA12]
MSFKTFDTERLFIRPTNKDDAQFIFELFNTPNWLKYIGNRNLHSIEDTERYIEIKMLPQLDRLGYSSYTLIRKEDGEKIGTCGLYDRDGLEGIDIGFAFLPRFEKQGFAFEASDRILKAAFNDLGLKSVNAITRKDNLSSQKLLEKLGLKLTGEIMLPNENEELLHYSISK